MRRQGGTGGSGHYVKMIHNGIEHGMMSAVAEAWQIMNLGLLMSYDQIADEFDRWNKNGEVVSRRDNFLTLVSISSSRISSPSYCLLTCDPIRLSYQVDL